MKYDRELVYIASLLHDLGLSASHAGDKRFEVDGADAASRFLLENEYPKSKADVVWDAIALHALADIADRKQPEAAIVHFGAYVDVMGLRMEEIAPSLIDDTLALYPRIGMKAAFTEALAEVARRKPHTAIGTGLADIGRRLVHGLEIPNACDPHRLTLPLRSGALVPGHNVRFAIHGDTGGYVKRGFDQQEAQLKRGMRPGQLNWGEDPSPGMLSRTDGDVTHETEVPNERGDYLSFYRSFADAIRDDRNPPVTVAQIRCVMAVMERCLESSAQRREFEFPPCAA